MKVGSRRPTTCEPHPLCGSRNRATGGAAGDARDGSRGRPGLDKDRSGRRGDAGRQRRDHRRRHGLTPRWTHRAGPPCGRAVIGSGCQTLVPGPTAQGLTGRHRRHLEVRRRGGSASGRPKLVAQERAAYAASQITMSHRGDGTTVLRATLPTGPAKTLEKVLQTAPSPPTRTCPCVAPTIATSMIPGSAIRSTSPTERRLSSSVAWCEGCRAASSTALPGLA